MVELFDIPIPNRHLSIYDPACGTGGMLSVAKEHLLDWAATQQERANVERFVTVHGGTNRAGIGLPRARHRTRSTRCWLTPWLPSRRRGRRRTMPNSDEGRCFQQRLSSDRRNRA